MAATARSANRWDPSNWTSGKLTVLQAMGVKTIVQYPKLQARFASDIAAGTQPQKNEKVPPHQGFQNNNQPIGKREASNKALAMHMAQSYGWGTGDQWNALNDVVMAESGWDNNAQNPNSTAYGIGQFLNTTWATVGGTKTSNPQAQIQYLLKYIKQRYGSPVAAWNFHLAHGWY